MGVIHRMFMLRFGRIRPAVRTGANPAMTTQRRKLRVHDAEGTWRVHAFHPVEFDAAGWSAGGAELGALDAEMLNALPDWMCADGIPPACPRPIWPYIMRVIVSARLDLSRSSVSGQQATAPKPRRDVVSLACGFAAISAVPDG
jgi:hypothetical protein